MKNLSTTELNQIIGGSISATMLGYMIRGVNAFLDIGRSLGSAIRRLEEHNLCPLK